MQTDAHMDVSACAPTLAFYMLLNFPPSPLLPLSSLLSLPPCAVPVRVGRAAAGHVGIDPERVRRALHLKFLFMKTHKHLKKTYSDLQPSTLYKKVTFLHNCASTR